MKIHVSKGNSKMGKIGNWSLIPVATCSKSACSTCAKNGCYALKAWKQYPAVRKAWTENTAIASQNLPEFKKQMIEYLKGYKGKRFRIHQAGDFFSLEYFLVWLEIMAEFPEIDFLAFTKQFDIILEWLFDLNTSPLPRNFALIASHWTGQTLPEDILTYCRIAWLAESPEDAESMAGWICEGDCSKCDYCWNGKKDVIFIKH